VVALGNKVRRVPAQKMSCLKGHRECCKNNTPAQYSFASSPFSFAYPSTGVLKGTLGVNALDLVLLCVLKGYSDVLNGYSDVLGT
jgi:hypothetical protein